MRDILFRGKRINNGEWVYGNYVYDYCFTGKAYIIFGVEADCVDGENADLCAIEWYEVELSTVGQYTGLTDKKGNKIFEGDIVKTKFFGKCQEDVNFADYDIFKIVYDKGAFYFEDSNRQFLIAEHAKAEVIGNLFDNQELLEVQE